MGTAIILFINFFIFYFYDKLSQLAIEKTDKIIFKKQSEYYSMQLRLMESSIKVNRAIKHDMANHLLIMQLYINNEQYNELKLHLSDTLLDYKKQNEYSNSGNIAIDSIINFKLIEASRNNINISTDINIPENLCFSSHDATIVLGNLLDNAIDALLKTEDDKRYLYVNLKYSKGRLIINIINSFDGNVAEKDGKIKTSHINKGEHGFGIKNVNNVVEKYNGIMNIKHEKNMFQVMIIIYID